MGKENGNNPEFEDRLLKHVTHMRFNRMSKLRFVWELESGQKLDPVEHRNAVNLLLYANGVQGYHARLVEKPTGVQEEPVKMRVELVRNGYK